ncbi:hypothetical protein ACQVP2_35800, partial [Methylobacterium aquaticum]|uniref:hypothetical protein n=1 Tax=Methylobacterium aquaticum TaxID=270351 RepID=UPI003D16C2E2
MQRLADVMGIQSRSLRAKMEFSRGIKPADLLKVADALDAQAIRTAEHAARLRRDAAGNDAGQPSLACPHGGSLAGARGRA